ncbi:hypothetical protein HD806DRAFT_177896 [Xylariaceae sp. AK1471]|nr:hypothetical protein HD806DRAFT_177896 [Xylariaceae sp. AK1471]
MTKGQKWHRDLDKVKKRTDEGRLAYDDDIYVPAVSKSSPHSPTADRQRHASVGSISREEVPEHAPSSVMVAPENLDDAKAKADEFLQALAAEFLFQSETVPRSVIVNTHDVEMGVDDGSAVETYLDDSNCSDADVEHESHVTPSPRSQRVLGPQFSPEIVLLFENRENPIIRSKIKRKTAYQMMKTSEGYLARPRAQAEELANVRSPLPHRSLNNDANDNVGVTDSSFRPPQQIWSEHR